MQYEQLKVKSIRCSCGERLYISSWMFDVLLEEKEIIVTCRKCNESWKVTLIEEKLYGRKIEDADKVCDIKCFTSGKPKPRRSTQRIRKEEILGLPDDLYIESNVLWAMPSLIENVPNLYVVGGYWVDRTGKLLERTGPVALVVKTDQGWVFYKSLDKEDGPCVKF